MIQVEVKICHPHCSGAMLTENLSQYFLSQKLVHLKNQKLG